MAAKTLVYVGAEANGLYRKEAGDGDWQQLSDGLPPSPQVRAIAIHPQNPDVIFVGTQRGVYRTQNRGDQWKRTNLPEGRIIWSLQFHPSNPQTMYAGTEGSEVYLSTDGGENWQCLSTIHNPEAIEMSWSTRIMSIGIEKANPRQMYAALEVGGVAHSADAGKSWELVSGKFVGNVDLMDLHGVAVGAPDSKAVFISNRVGVWRSLDRGDTWENLHLEKSSPIIYSRGVRVAPNDPNTVYACVGGDFGSEKGGLMRSADLGDTWERIDRGITSGSTTFGVAINAQDPKQVYFCSRRGQVFGTHDGGATWKESVLPKTATNVISVACASA
ncbi:MAG: hypothetical protein L0177_13925 [Chloroflexi bacterium]|nr:hypothetical protein [Chloroflexota bacterium]